MATTDISPADRAAVFSEVERLTGSSVLHGSEALCKLLRYLAEQHLAHPGAPVKEYQLATEVFGRQADFDPRMDATVRVQTGRLRSKVAEYYASEGVADPIVIEVPKGSYSLSFHYRPPSSAEMPATPRQALVADLPSPLEIAPPRASRKRLIPLVWTLAGISAVSTATAGFEFWRAHSTPHVTAVAEKAPPSLTRFWAPFIATSDPPWIIFSNAEFVGRPQDGMRYFDVARDRHAAILDHYTGVGEVLGVAELLRDFQMFGHDVRIKRGRLLSLDDLKNTDVVFLGSSAENLALREIPTTQDFVFRRIESGDRHGDTEIVNVHPRPGEAATFLASAALPIVEDYALIGMVPGMNQSRWILVIAGTTTMGTQAAAEFVSREQSLKQIFSRVPAKSAARPFEAVIKVRITEGVPVSSTLVAVHFPEHS